VVRNRVGSWSFLDERHQAVAHIDQQHPGEHVDLVVADQLAVLGDGGGRVALGVLLDQLDLAAARLVSDLLERQLEPVEHVLAGLGEDAGERAEIADADRFGGRRRPHRRERGGEQAQHDQAGADQSHGRGSFGAKVTAA